MDNRCKCRTYPLGVVGHWEFTNGEHHTARRCWSGDGTDILPLAEKESVDG